MTPLVSWWQVLLQSQWSWVTAWEGVQNSEALTIPKGTPECGCTVPKPTAVHLQGKKWTSGPLHVTLSPFRALLVSAPWPQTIWNYLVAHPAHTHWCPTLVSLKPYSQSCSQFPHYTLAFNFPYSTGDRASHMQKGRRRLSRDDHELTLYWALVEHCHRTWGPDPGPSTHAISTTSHLSVGFLRTFPIGDQMQH